MLEPRKNFEPQIVARGGVRVRIGVILDVRNVVRSCVGDELLARLLQKWADNVALLGPHTTQAAQIRPADEVQEHCFRIVI